MSWIGEGSLTIQDKPSAKFWASQPKIYAMHGIDLQLPRGSNAKMQGVMLQKKISEPYGPEKKRSKPYRLGSLATSCSAKLNPMQL